MADPLYTSTPAPINPLLDLNLNMDLNPEAMVHDNIYNVKYRQLLKQIRVSHAMFKMTSFIDFGLYSKSFIS